VFSKWPTLEPPTDAATTKHFCFFFSSTPIPIPIPYTLLLLRCSVDEGRKRDWCFVTPKTRIVLIPELTNPSMETSCFQNPVTKTVALSKTHERMKGAIF